MKDENDEEMELTDLTEFMPYIFEIMKLKRDGMELVGTLQKN